MPSVWEVGQCMSSHLYLESQLLRPLARVETGLGSLPALRSPRQSQPKGFYSEVFGRLEVQRCLKPSAEYHGPMRKKPVTWIWWDEIPPAPWQ